MPTATATRRQPHVTLSSDGHPGFRTDPISRERADSYAHMLDLSGDFLSIEIYPSRSPGKWYVVSVPSDIKRRERIQYAMITARQDRAATRECDFYADPDDPSLEFCHSHHSGKVYELTMRGGKAVNCTCPDRSKGHARRGGLPCYHIIARNEPQKRLGVI